MFTVQSALCLCISTTLLIAYELCNSQLFAHFYTARDYLRRRCRWHSTIKCMLKCCFSCIRICKYTLPFAPFAFLLLYSPIRHAIAILSSNVIRRRCRAYTPHNHCLFLLEQRFPLLNDTQTKNSSIGKYLFFFLSLSLNSYGTKIMKCFCLHFAATRIFGERFISQSTCPLRELIYLHISRKFDESITYNLSSLPFIYRSICNSGWWKIYK